MSYDNPRFDNGRLWPGRPAGAGGFDWAGSFAESGAWYMDAADAYLPLGDAAGTASVLVQSRFEDRFETGWLGILAVAPDGAIRAAWTGHGYVPPAPGHVAGWRLNQTQRLHLLRRQGGAEGALVLAQNRHRQEQQSVGLLTIGPGGDCVRAAWAAERIIPPRRPGGPAWPIRHGDRYQILGGGAGDEPNPLLVHGEGDAVIGGLSFDPGKGGLVTDWLSEGAVPPPCTLADGPSASVVTLDPCARAFRLAAVARGVVPRPAGPVRPGGSIAATRCIVSVARALPGRSQCSCIVASGTVRSAIVSACSPTIPRAGDC